MSRLEATLVSESIDASPDAVYEFARQVENLPQWASGLATGIRQEAGEWVADSPMGVVKVAMQPRNPFRVLDHDVTLPDGRVVHNACRVTPAGDGAVISFVLLRMPGVSAGDFERDAAHVAQDLKTLKALLER